MPVNVNLDKSKTIKKDKLRRERIEKLAVEDVKFQRALETGADTSAIVAEKQRLRNLPDLVDAATSLDEIRAITVESGD